MGHSVADGACEPAAQPEAVMDHSEMDHSTMDHGSMPAQDGHPGMTMPMDAARPQASPESHDGMDHGVVSQGKPADGAMDHSQMNHGEMGQSQDSLSMDNGHVDHRQMNHGKTTSQAKNGMDP